MEQRNNKTNQLDEIHRNPYEIRAKFVKFSYQFHNASIFTQVHSREIRTKFVPISYEFHANFIQFADEQSKHTSKHTLQSHGHVIDHAPAFQHLSDRHAGALLTTCQSVVGRTGGATPDMAKWMSHSASTLSPLQTSIWFTLSTKKSLHCSETSMTARSEAGADWERKVGWKGQVGGPAGTASGASAKRAWAAPPSHNPTLPTAPFPTHKTWSVLGKSPLNKSPATARASWGGGVQVRGVGLVVAVPGIGGPRVKKSPLQPILGVEGGGGGNPWWRLVATINSMSPLCNGMVSHRASPASPRAGPPLHRHLVVL